MITRTAVQSRWWRLFALAIVVFAAPILLANAWNPTWARSALGAIALFGLVGFAFGFRVGPRLFWQAFALVFCCLLAIKLGSLAGPAMHSFPAPPPGRAQSLPTIMFGLAIFAGLAIALFRHSELVSRPVNPHRVRKPEPLLRSAELGTEAWQKYAEARARLEKPMDPAMQSEALAFGPHRQLSLEQQQRLVTVMLVTTMVVQVAIAFSDGRTGAILLPALALLIGTAIVTYHSAEFILKTHDALAKSWPVLCLIAAIIVASFLVDRPLLSVARTVFVDCLAVLTGNGMARFYWRMR